MATVQAPPLHGFDQRVVIHGLTWDNYVNIRDQLRDVPVRLTFNQGTLEIMTLSLEHERAANLLGSLIDTLTDETGFNCVGGGSTTMRREDLDRGLESDKCYWIINERVMRDRDEYDPAVDPAPDLVIEVEVSRPVAHRLKIYEALRVPEVWRFDGKVVHVHVLGADGHYTKVAASMIFPFLPMAELSRFLAMRSTLSDNEIRREFRAWVRAQIAAGVFPSPQP